MSYVPFVILVVGLVILALAVRGPAGAAKRLAVTRGHVTAEVDRSTGLLKARMAALRIAVRDRRRPRTIDKSTEA